MRQEGSLDTLSQYQLQLIQMAFDEGLDHRDVSFLIYSSSSSSLFSPLLLLSFDHLNSQVSHLDCKCQAIYPRFHKTRDM